MSELNESVDMFEVVETKCKGCGKPIYWLNVEGKSIPLDRSAPVYEITDNVKSQGRRADRMRFAVSHFATCPKANDFSATKAKEKP